MGVETGCGRVESMNKEVIPPGEWTCREGRRRWGKSRKLRNLVNEIGEFGECTFWGGEEGGGGRHVIGGWVGATIANFIRRTTA